MPAAYAISLLDLPLVGGGELVLPLGLVLADRDEDVEQVGGGDGLPNSVAYAG